MKIGKTFLYLKIKINYISSISHVKLYVQLLMISPRKQQFLITILTAYDIFSLGYLQLHLKNFLYNSPKKAKKRKAVKTILLLQALALYFKILCKKMQKVSNYKFFSSLK